MNTMILVDGKIGRSRVVPVVDWVQGFSRLDQGPTLGGGSSDQGFDFGFDDAGHE